MFKNENFFSFTRFTGLETKFLETNGELDTALSLPPLFFFKVIVNIVHIV